MLYAVLRYLIPFAALLAVGPLARHLTDTLRGLDGGSNVSLLVGANPASGVTVALAVFAIAAVMGSIGALLVGKRMGLFCAGLVLTWAACGTGRADLILGEPQAAGSLRTLALEGAMVGLLGAITAAAILWTPTMRFALPEVRDPERNHQHLPPEPMQVLDRSVPVALLAVIAAAAVAVWLIAQETLKGQTIAAAVIAGIAASSAGRMTAQRLSAVWFFVGIGILAALAPLVASLLNSSPAEIARTALAGHLFVLARPLPLDLIAGAFLGIPIGLVWTGSLVEQAQPKPVPAR